MILVPLLVYLGGINVSKAITTAMMCYLLTGAIGTYIYAKNRSINWSIAVWVCAGAMPAALAGSWLSNHTPEGVLELVIGGLTMLSGFQAMRPHAESANRVAPLGTLALVAIGSLTGVLSAITGTGGPLILVPLMLWFHIPVLTTIGLSQVVQLPIASLATAGNIAFGKPDLLFGAVLAISLASGSFIGAHLTHKLPTDLLKRVVAIVLLIVGFSIIFKVLA